MRAAAELADGRLRVARSSAGWPGAPSATWRSSSCASWRTQGAEAPVVPADRGGGGARRAAARGAARRRDPARHARGDRHGRARGRLLLGLHAHVRHRARTGESALEVYELVLRAQTRGARAPRGPGRSARRSTPWRARSSTRPATGSTSATGSGHGVGLEVHEAPRLGEDGGGRAGGRQRGDRRARASTCPATFGVRIEDLVIVTDGEPDDPHRASRRTSSRSPDAAGRGGGVSRGRSSSPPPGFGFALVLSPALFAVMEPEEAVTGRAHRSAPR